jgi:hypothetical protein
VDERRIPEGSGCALAVLVSLALYAILAAVILLVVKWA